MPTTLILDEFQTWFDGLSDTAGDTTGPKRRQWAFNFIQILSELSKERPDLFMLVVSVRDSTTEAFRQIHRALPLTLPALRGGPATSGNCVSRDSLGSCEYVQYTG